MARRKGKKGMKGGKGSIETPFMSQVAGRGKKRGKKMRGGKKRR